jgi:serine-type D-Ala-D-Ala carboxypeptidase/endopeptidase
MSGTGHGWEQLLTRSWKRFLRPNAPGRRDRKGGFVSETAPNQAQLTVLSFNVDDVARKHVGIVAGALTSTGQSLFYATGHTRTDGAEPTEQTMFQVGSVTKVFTALALADAVVKQEVSLDTPLSCYLPEARSSRMGLQITLGQLASHASGLPRLPPGFLRRHALRNPLDPYRGFSTEELLAGLAKTRFLHEPGTKYHYSNFGTALLGEALCRHDESTYEQVIARRVSGPLGLSSTTTEPDTNQLSRLAVGHSRHRVPVPCWAMDAMAGAGALYSTARDLLVFLGAHLEPDATPMAEALRLVQESRVRAGRMQVGLGWHRAIHQWPKVVLWHNGGTGGYRCYIAFVQEGGLGVVVLTNTARSVDRVGIRLLERLSQFNG